MAKFISEKKLFRNDVGYVRLVDIMPSDRNCDQAVVDAARTCYDGLPTKQSDKSLIRYLMRHRHTTPFEMVEFKWEMQMPIFIARQLIRHRTANVNEVSARYTPLPDNFFYFDTLYKQDQSSKQCSSPETIDPALEAEFLVEDMNLCNKLYDLYQRKIKAGVSREQARYNLPLNICTKWVWKNDLHNTLHLLSLRADKHAQKEARDIANAMISLIEPYAPEIFRAWNDYHPMRGAITFSAKELPYISIDKNASPVMSEGELKEFWAKAERLKNIG